MGSVGIGMREEVLEPLPFAIEKVWKYDVVVDASNAIVVRGNPKPHWAGTEFKPLITLGERHDPQRHRGATYKIVDGHVVRVIDLKKAEDDLLDEVLRSEGARELVKKIGPAVRSIHKRAFSKNERADGPYFQIRTDDAVDLLLVMHAETAPTSLKQIPKANEIVEAIANEWRAPGVNRAPGRLKLSVDLETGAVMRMKT